MQIRSLTIDDASFLRTALYHAIHVPPEADMPDPDIIKHPDIARYVDGWMKQTDDLGLVSEIAGVPVGAAWLRRWAGKEHGFGFIDKDTPELSMSVLPVYRGQGIGTLLLNSLLKAAEPRFKGVSLSVSLSNPARRMYERAGFLPVKKPDNRSIIMLRKFKP